MTRHLPIAFTLFAALAVAGCSSSSSTPNQLLVTPGLPTPPAPTTSNTYFGTGSPGIWSLSLDDVALTYTYQPQGGIASPGAFTLEGGILNFGQGVSGSAGQAIEIPSRAAILRPGDNTTSPVAFVAPPSTCFPVTGRLNFIFAGFMGVRAGFASSNAFDAAYGRVVVSTTPDGKTWTFGDELKYQIPTIGGGRKPGTTYPTGAPLSYTGTCTAGVITADPNAALTVQPTFVFNAAGHFIQDRPAPTSDTLDNSANSYIGVAMSPKPLVAADIIGHSYEGFVFEPGPTGRPATQPMRLDPVTAAVSVAGSAGLLGGAFPNDDPTAIAGTEFTITLGAQDATYNGVFPLATLVHSDPSGNCPLVNYNQDGQDPNALSDIVLPGFDANGNPICTTRGVAVVGQPEGRYVIYFTALDGTTADQDNAHPLQMYLYQQ